jgi:D-sedoheptulose 7-phosphate isomerase
MTAWSNDVSYEDVFVGQLKSLMRPGDVVLAISGSGNSPNVLRAVELARSMGGITIGFSGFDGGKLSTLVDVPVVTPSDCMEQIEDVHVVLCHLIATVLREQMQERQSVLRLPLFAARDVSVM